MQGDLSSWDARLQSINASLYESVPIRWTAEKCRVQPWVVAALLAAWLTSFILWGFTGEFVCMIVGYLYPMYGSFRALEDGHMDSLDKEAWLKYWATLSVFTVCETFFYRLLVWVPFYHVTKVIFIAWLFLPATQGAQTTYEHVVEPLLKRYEGDIGAAFTQSVDELRSAVSPELRQALSNAVANSKASVPPVKRNLGIDDLMVRELQRDAAALNEKVKAVPATPSRARNSSPTRSPMPPRMGQDLPDID